MDWAKAKTILIAVFLAINIFLAYMIFGASSGSIGYVDVNKIQKVTDYLAEKNIIVTAQVPLRKSNMPSITVKYKLFKKEDIIARLFASGENAAVAMEGDTLKLSNRDVGVSIKSSRELNYINNTIRPAAEINDKVCSKKIREFLTSLGMKDDAGIKTVENLEGYKKFVYRQSFKGSVIYNAVMEFHVNDKGVYKARIIWFETIKQVGKRSDVISPVVAMMALPELYKEKNPGKLEVQDIQQGYYFGTGASNQVDVSKVEEGTAFQVWRISTEKDIIYINAYNEKVEDVEKRH